MSARHVRLPNLLMERHEPAVAEKIDQKTLNKYARPELLFVDKWLTQNGGGVSLNFPIEFVKRRYVQR